MSILIKLLKGIFRLCLAPIKRFIADMKELRRICSGAKAEMNKLKAAKAAKAEAAAKQAEEKPSPDGN